MLKLPLNGDDVMKALDSALDRAVAVTKPIKDLTVAVKSLATALERLGLAVSVLAHNQEVHNAAILQLQQRQGIIFRKVVGDGLDMSMPKIKEDEPEASKSAKNKPN